MTKHVNIKIVGKVQGVYFRKSAYMKALELNIKGIVRNEKNGSVYIEAEADKEDLSHFIKWCHKGPQGAVVNHVDIAETVVKNYTDFTITHS